MQHYTSSKFTIQANSPRKERPSGTFFTLVTYFAPIKIKYYPNFTPNLYLITGIELGYQESSELLLESYYSPNENKEHYV